MKLTLAILAFCVLSVPAFACEGFEHDMNALEHEVNQSAKPSATFAREFESRDELKTWTETSTLGGGRFEEASFEGRKFIFAYRSYTSGVKNSDAAVYMEEGDQWKLVKAYPVLMNDWIVADQQADGSILFHPEGENRSLMVLSKADLALF